MQPGGFNMNLYGGHYYEERPVYKQDKSLKGAGMCIKCAHSEKRLNGKYPEKLVGWCNVKNKLCRLIARSCKGPYTYSHHA
jgi:hypothetical protein